MKTDPQSRSGEGRHRLPLTPTLSPLRGAREHTESAAKTKRRTWTHRSTSARTRRLRTHSKFRLRRTRRPIFRPMTRLRCCESCASRRSMIPTRPIPARRRGQAPRARRRQRRSRAKNRLPDQIRRTTPLLPTCRIPVRGLRVPIGRPSLPPSSRRGLGRRKTRSSSRASLARRRNVWLSERA